MNRLTKIIAIALIALALLLAAAAWWMGSRPASAPRSIAPAADTPSYLVVAAARKLTEGQQITMEDVKLISSPMQIAGAYQDVASVIGRIPTVDIEPDIPIVESSLVHGLALKLSDGERAVAIPVDETMAVGHKIEAGDYVDVFFTMKPGSNVERGQARLLASRMRVLAYGASIVGEAPSGSLPAKSTPARTAVLAASLDQVNPLLLAMQNGKLTLALRHPGDAGMADAALFPQPDTVLPPRAGLSAPQKEALQSADNRAFAGDDLSSWANGKSHAGKPSVARQPFRTPSPSGTLEVIKGSQREKVNF